MSARFKFILRVAAFSLVLYLGSELIFEAYNRSLWLLYQIFRPISLVGFMQSYNSAARTIPFIILLLATPGISWKRRLAWLVGGAALFMVMDIAATVAWGGPPLREQGFSTSEAHFTWSLIWDTTGHWLLPLLLWLVAAHRQVLEICSGGCNTRTSGKGSPKKAP